ncbi:LysR family transcriptional regulator [Pseudodonghicola xiamenensis]|uniref:LysR family transcriptional regulator n=1 Tax=Pseudodonghicola xiamenensis TaxID=337702 RepID=A0A8J3MFC8_9RHOB|nr:LysR family transcriptional regulator [Pseudodonghicola xiamenensis]GHG93930.1 LysR family transcriptional regulator [Pseudodonghicola xiamenensis]
MDWENIRFFRTLVESGSVAAAARELGVERTTVTRRIQALESDTGLNLFDRRGRSLALTAVGRDFADATQPMMEAAREAERCAAGMRPGMVGRVKISAPPALAKSRLVGPLLSFGRRYPELKIQLTGEIGFASMQRGEADIAVRLTRPQKGDLAISKLGSIAFRLYAHRDYIAHTSEEDRLYIGQGDVPDAMPQQVALNRIAGGRFAFYADDVDLQLAAVLEKGGIAALPDFLAANREELVKVGSEEPLLVRDIWSVTHNSQRHQERIRRTIELFRSALT